MQENIFSKYSSDDMKAEDVLEFLTEQIKSGGIQSVDDIISSLENPAERELIKKFSLLQSFDETVFEEIISQVETPADYKELNFENFTRNSDIKRIPRTSNKFFVRDGVLQDFLQEIKSAAKSVVQVAKVVGENFLDDFIALYREDDKHELDLLGLLVLTDPVKAEKQFLNMYRAADEKFDLTLCHDILKVLELRQTLLTPELEKLVRQTRQYLKARNLFSNEYIKTTFYYPRAVLVQEFSELLEESASADAPHWIFHLFATGGMGKTIFLQWLIARCVICEPRKIPVARLDFDYLHLPNLERYPWLLMLAVFEQLNQQIENSPFSRHLSSYWHFAALLYPPDGSPGDDSRASLEEQIQNISAGTIKTLLNKSFDTLRESGFQKPFVVVLDTLEESILHYRRCLVAILVQFEEIHKLYPPMNLLLSGRYDLRERLPELKTLFEQSIALELNPFDKNEARSYLSEVRKLGDEDVIKAIITKTYDAERHGNNPFKIALFADLFQSKTIKTAAEVLSYPRTDFAYLIERIIDRIKEPGVQWLVRYAVIPRRLTFDVFEKVLAAHLERELIKKQHIDYPNEKLPERYDNLRIWREEKSAALDLQKIWNDLKNYSGDKSWISFDAGNDGFPHLHTDVIVPMRLLLAEHEEIFNFLHKDLERYFKEKADAEKNEEVWAENICEVIYHRFQIEGASAAEFWRKQFDTAEAQKNPFLRRKIAKEITGADYTNETQEPIKKRDGQFLINPSDLLEAHYRAVEASLSLLINLMPKTADATTSEWSGIREHLTFIEKLEGENIRLPKQYQSPFDENVLRRLAEEMRGEQPGKNTPNLFKKAAAAKTATQLNLSLEMQIADTFVHFQDERAFVHFEKALDIQRKIKYPQIGESAIVLRIGSFHHELRNLSSAEKFYQEGLALAVEEKNLIEQQTALRYLADVHFEFGQYDEAFGRLEKARRITKNTAAENAFVNSVLTSQILARNLYEPLEALERITPFLQIAEKPRERAAINELRGYISGVLMQFDDALTFLEEAGQFWGNAGKPPRAEEAELLRIKLQFLEIGNYNEVSALLDAREREKTKPDFELDCQIRLFRVLFEFRCGNEEKAREHWEKLVTDELVRKSPTVYVRVLTTGLALGFDGQSVDFEQTSIVREFIAELEKIEPASARLPVLENFRYAETSFAPTPAETVEIKNLITFKTDGKNKIPYAILRADMLNCCGDTESAKKILIDAKREALNVKNSYAYRRILLACDRLTDDLLDDDIFKSNFMRDFADYLNLRAAGYIEQAGRFLERGETSECRECLAEARNCLDKSNGLLNRFEALLNELTGQVEQLDGNTEAALINFNFALSTYERLGNKRAAARLKKLLPATSESVSDDDEIFSLHLSETAEMLRVDLNFGNFPKHQGNFRTSEFKVFSSAITAGISDISQLYMFSKLAIAYPKELENEAGRILISNEAEKNLEKRKKTPTDLRLDSLSTALAKMPWELAAFRDRPVKEMFRYFYRSEADSSNELEKIKWLQTALRYFTDPGIFIDGIFGRQTQESVEKLKKKFELPKNLSIPQIYSHLARLLKQRGNKRSATVLIIQSAGQSFESQRSIVSSGSSLQWAYRNASFKIYPFDGENINELKRLTEKIQPDIVHIRSAYRVLPGTDRIFLDFGFSKSGYKAERSNAVQTSTTFLHDALGLLSRKKLRPLLILDAVAAPGITENLHQILYRNAFAAEMFRFGNTSGVIAMGLAENKKLQSKTEKMLVKSLSEVESFGEIVKNLRNIPHYGHLEDKLPTAGIALFTNEPLMTVISE